MDAAPKAYIDQLYAVPGFLTPLDATLLAVLADAQTDSGTGGDLLEIGCWFGRTSILLGFLAGPGESLHVSDLFGATPTTPAGQREASASSVRLATRSEFETFYRRFHSEGPVIHEGPSSALRTAELGLGRFRLIHIDGSHVFDVVRHDIQLARELVRDGGIIVFDDYANPGHPGVAAATWPALRNGELEPFACSPSKLYAAIGSASAAAYRSAVEQQLSAMGTELQTCELPQGTILTLSGMPWRTTLRSRVLRRGRRLLTRTQMAIATAALPIAGQTGDGSLALL